MSEQSRNIKYIACNLCGTFPDEAIAMRFRRVCNILDLQKFVPDDDMELYRCMFSVLGIMARTLESQKAATAEANKRVEALEGEVAESDFVIDKFSKMLAEICLTLKGDPPYCTRFSYHDLPKIVKELQANNHDLREALKTIAIESHEELWQREFAFKALSATPAESLQAHDDELLEKVISTIESLNVDAMFKPVSFSDMFVAIRALKGK